MAEYIANQLAVVRVDGSPITVEPSTQIPDGVEQSEIDRLLQFGVITEAAAPAPAAPAVHAKAPTAPKETAKE